MNVIIAKCIPAVLLIFGLASCTGNVEQLKKPESTLPKKISLDLGKDVKLELALIPAGTFMMGLPLESPYRIGKEWSALPLRKVKISKPFYMGMYEVTFEQYWTIMGKENCPYNKAAKRKPAILKTRMKGPKFPVDWLSPQDALDFCRKVSEKTGRTVRLPTEAEWEYACRAGTKTLYSFGDNPKKGREYGWSSGNTKDGINRPAKVGLLKPNPWGLYDMHGNQCEYCADWFYWPKHKEYKEFYNSKGTAVNPKVPIPKEGEKRLNLVIRSGEYITRMRHSAFRYGVTWAGQAHGMRVVVEVQSPQRGKTE